MRRVLVALVSLALVPLAAHADPLAVKSGKVVLPMTGLAIDLPKDARKGATWMLSGSWALTKGGASFDGRDVVDLKVGDKLVAGNWIHVGYFDSGDCAAVVKELDVPDRWLGERDLWGQHFQVAGGTFDLENGIGKVPSLALCVSAPNEPSLLLYHFFLDAKPPVGAAGLKAIAKDKLLERATKAWRAHATGRVQPTRHPEIRRRGDIEAARTVHLGKTNLDIALPDDGFVWLARDGADDAADFLDRMAPAWPDVTLELARAPGMTCADVKTALTSDAKVVAEPPPLGVPAGWVPFPTMQLDDAQERVICRELGPDALIVGLLGKPVTSADARDFGPLAAILGAIADGAAKAK
ncbi:MAG: hypothetical protein K8W52_05055 [Deltaproteobacteria bacterium]|nr:hypothetical protein [Deltaproteobacteria bacterium]